MPIDAGSLDRRITIEQLTTTKDAFNADVETWEPYAERWASVSFGTGQERRAAAQDSASAPATFRVRWDTETKVITPGGYRIQFMGAAWDITSAVPFGRNEGVDITAIRAA